MSALTRYHRLRSAKRCISCREPSDGRYACFPCRVKLAAQHRTRRSKKRAAGTCVRCPDPARPGMALCRPCGQDESARTAEYNRNRRDLEVLNGQA